MRLVDNLEALQQPAWPNQVEIRDVRIALEQQTDLVSPSETDELQWPLSQVAMGEAFVVQAGPCAESLETSPKEVFDLTVAMEHLREPIGSAANLPSVPIFRLAGQFCKPRSSDTETIDDITLLSFRGELVNDAAFTADARTPDPQRLLRAHESASTTRDQLKQIAPGKTFTAHELLLLDYELPQIRKLKDDSLQSTSADFLWIGDRTRNINGAHVALAAAINNPIGVKVGPGTKPAEVAELCERLNPHRIPGRLSLIPRLGAKSIGHALGPIIEAVTADQHSVIWIVDPMHGNTVTTESGKKTRPFEAIMREIDQFFKICAEQQVWPGGVHLEMSGQNVTECLGGPVTEIDSRFETLCDPRINLEQAKLIGVRLAELLAHARKSVAV